MYYLSMWIVNGMAAHLIKCNCKRYKRYPMQWMELIIICCGTAVKRMGILGVCVRKMNAQTVKMETATLIGKGR
jgi:hypothetical protein